MTETHGVQRAHYAQLARVPGVPLFAVASVFARVPIAMSSIAILLYVQRMEGTFASSGVVGGSVLVGVAGGTLVQGRLLDAFGTRRALGPVLVAFAAVAALTFWAVEAHAPVAVLVVCALLFGLTQPAVSAASRSVWAKALPPGPVQEAALTYEAISLEVFFIVGPAVAGMLAATPWAGTGLLVAVLLMVAGTLGFLAAPLAGRARAGSSGVQARRIARRESARRSRELVRNPGMHTLVVLAGGFGVLLGAVEVTAPAVAASAGQLALSGVLLGGWSLTSVVFGLIYAGRPWPRALHRRAPLLLAAFAALIALMALPHGLIGFVIALLVAGSLITPQATVHSLLVGRVAPAAASGEAFAWVVTAVTLGLGIGQAAAGPLFTAYGVAGSLLPAVVFGMLLAGVAWLRRATLAPAAGASASSASRDVDGLPTDDSA